MGTSAPAATSRSDDPAPALEMSTVYRPRERSANTRSVLALPPAVPGTVLMPNLSSNSCSIGSWSVIAPVEVNLTLLLSFHNQLPPSRFERLVRRRRRALTWASRPPLPQEGAAWL